MVVYKKLADESKSRETQLDRKNEELQSTNRELRAKLRQVLDTLEANSGRFFRVDKENLPQHNHSPTAASPGPCAAHSTSRPRMSPVRAVSPKARVPFSSRSPMIGKSHKKLAQSPKTNPNTKDLMRGIITALAK